MLSFCLVPIKIERGVIMARRIVTNNNKKRIDILRPNLTIVRYETGEVYFSYQTEVAFRGVDGQLIVSQNEWSNTTGRHLNIIDGGNKEARIPHVDFMELLEEKIGILN